MTRLESWPGDYMGKATPFWQLSSSTAEPSHRNPVGEKACSSTKGGLLRYILNSQHLLDSQSFEFEICILQALNMPLICCTNVFFLRKATPSQFIDPQESTRYHKFRVPVISDQAVGCIHGLGVYSHIKWVCICHPS